MAGRSPARFLAPLALVAFGIALYLVVVSTTRDGAAGEREASPAAQATATPAAKKGKRSKRRYYRIRAGDTPSGIAEKTGVPLDELLQLNPRLDPQSLSPGTRITLRR